MDLKDTYNEIAADWHKDHLEDDWWTEGTKEFVNLLPPKAHVLDIGCGSGLKSKFLTSHGLKVTGIDFSAELLKIAQKTVPEATFLLMDMRDISSLPDMYDGIFSQASLLHIPKTDAMETVRSWLPKLKVNGHLYIAVKEIKEGRAEEEQLIENDYGYEYQRFFSYFILEEIEIIFESLGLEIVYKGTQTPSNRWIQVIGRKR